ncbi:hypothetical protein C4D60_Mb10t08160 [Musa balbisiana]|uniref:RRM domain-containing protein n=1 Tax=Musa balbisiana TaxID=52838 RepID=A0A4S8IVH7_MUSBA|nr:hypothetical protein C4D60_Mb10t08160 [Musa balbisiana]
MQIPAPLSAHASTHSTGFYFLLASASPEASPPVFINTGAHWLCFFVTTRNGEGSSGSTGQQRTSPNDRSRCSSYSRSVSRSRSPYRYSRTVSRSLSRSRSRSRSMDSSDAENPGNNLYVTGLSSRVTKDELEKHFASEGKVVDVHLVVDPWTRESRGFGFVTLSTIEEADSCINYLNRSVLEGRVITVEKARRRRGRTPTPGRYLGVKTSAHHHSVSYSPYGRRRYSSPGYTSDRDRSYSPYDRRRAYSPYYRRRRSRSVSPCSRRRRSYSRDLRSSSSGCSASPYYHRRCEHSWSRSISPRSRYRRHYSPRRSPRRGFSHSYSPRDRRSRRSYSRSYSPRYRRSRSCSPKLRPSKRSPSSSKSPGPRKRYSRESYAHSRSVSSSSSSR